MADENEFDERIYDILLKTFEKELNAGLEGYYVWNFELALKKLDNPIFEMINEKINQVNSIPCKTIALKQKLKDVMLKDIIAQNEIGNEESWNLYSKFVKWVVVYWGGISFDVSKNKDKLCKLWKRIKTDGNGDDYTDIIGFEDISSLSKVASFLDEEKYAVYDSRVAFSLNWLLFINGLHCKDEKYGKMKFFRQPGEGQERNSDMKEHRQLPVFKKFFWEKVEGKEIENNKLFFKTFYYCKDENYQKYCELLDKTVKYYNNHKSDYRQIGKKQITISELEMCLFSIAAKNKKIKELCKYDENGYITNDMDRLQLEKTSKIAIKSCDD
ncbi:hypothetical protein [Fibrobacter sp. UWP2]|uniref:hypothetical protein n=1 Tax=Fibrobacter sp. UWP2 TaxID=1896216 RepID=UPI000923F314|nr:hypothetical protein [Fibrobacter sp. UWP2]SHI79540.1 hypothetical protein SAMN05720471_1085 [Fibrobacter sp. UWP2]